MDRLVGAKVMYFVYYFSQSALLNFLSAHGFSKSQIGCLLAFPWFMSILGAPFWGYVADRTKQQRLVHIFALVSGGCCIYSIRFVSSYNRMVGISIIAFFQIAPTAPMLDQVVMSLLREHGGEYGKQRLYGGIGYGIGALVTGEVVKIMGVEWFLDVHLLSVACAVVVLLFLPVFKNKEKREKAPSNRFGWLTHHLDILSLFLLVLFMGLCFGILSSFLTLFLFNLSEHNSRIIGIAIAFETFSEVPAFFYADTIIKTLGITRVLLISIAAYVVRLTYCIVIQNPWSILPFELLHSCTYSLSWAACTNYTYGASPPDRIGTMMGLLSSMLNGYGRTIGTLAGGYVYSRYGPRAMWLITDVGIIPLALVAWCFFHRYRSSNLMPVISRSEDEAETSIVFEARGTISPARNPCSPSVFLPVAKKPSEVSPLLDGS